jgi:septum formation protein
MAREKAETVWRQRNRQDPVLGADTEVVVDGRVFGKPANPAEARDMLLELSGRAHEVFSGVALISPAGDVLTRLSRTRVEFAELDADWIDSYVASGEPMDKAGAYGVQGAAAWRIRRLEGSYWGVMGLPLYETGLLLDTLGNARSRKGGSSAASGPPDAIQINDN